MTAPAVVLAPTSDMPRDEWLTRRRKGIGGSDAAAILGLDPFRSPLAVYLDKTGELPEQPRNEAMEWGNRLEAAVAEGAIDRLNDERDGPALTHRERHELLQHPELPFVLANLDREIVGHEAGSGVLECKTTGLQQLAWWEDDEHGGKAIPDRYELQLQHYLAVTGWSFGYLAVLVGGNALRVEFRERDQALIDSLLEVEERFWRGVESRTPPPADGSERTKKAIARAFPQVEALKVSLPPEAADLIAQQRAAAAAEKHAHGVKVTAENRLKMLLREAGEGWLPGLDKPAITFREVAGGPVSYYRDTYRKLLISKDA